MPSNFAMTTDRMRRLRRLSMTRRWSATPVLRPQNVDAHSYQIMPIALWLAQFHRTVSVEKDAGEILLYCLVHDEAESVSGDHPSPFKAVIGPELRAWEYSKEYGQTDRSDIKNLVKVADCLEALVFVQEDQKMGNRALGSVWKDIFDKMSGAWAQFDWIIGGPGTNKYSPERLVILVTEIFDLDRHPMMEQI